MFEITQQNTPEMSTELIIKCIYMNINIHR